MSDDETAMAAILLAIAVKRKRDEEKKKRKKRIWSKEWLKNHRNPWDGKVLKELEYTSDNDFESCVRMSENTFNDLLSRIQHLIAKKNTIMRDSIPPKFRLSLTLRFLVSGMKFENFKFLTSISPQTIGRAVIEVCYAIVHELNDYIKLPQTQADWRKEENTFNNVWNFPNCIGAIDGRHIEIIKPAGSGKQYLNYMKSYSVVLMAMVNANYEFMMIDMNMSGNALKAEIEFLSELEEKAKNIPKPTRLPGFEEKMPYIFVASNEFSLTENIMKPFSEKELNIHETIFNYKIARVRRTIETTFGILASRFKILLQTINLSPEKVKIITLACCYLHNYLIRRSEDTYLDGGFGFEDNENAKISYADWQNGPQLCPLEPNDLEYASELAKNVRNRFCNYFSTSETVPWKHEPAEKKHKSEIS